MRARKTLVFGGIALGCAALLMGSAVAIAQAFSRAAIYARAMPLETQAPSRDLPSDRAPHPSLERLEMLSQEARFPDVLREAARLRVKLRATPDRPERTAHVETVAASAHLALGEHAAAEECFARALRAVPGWTLDPHTTSPKILQAFAKTRARRVDGAAAIEANDLAAAGGTAPRAIVTVPLRAPGECPSLRPTIVTRMQIDERGNVMSAAVLRPRPELAHVEQLALEAARAHRFEPARLNGKAVSVWLNWPMQLEVE